MKTSTSEAAILKPQLKRAAGNTRIDNLCEIIAKKDYVILPSAAVRSLLCAEDEGALDDWSKFQKSRNRLEQDQFMKDGGTYRFDVMASTAQRWLLALRCRRRNLTTRASRTTPSTAGLPGISPPSNRRSRRARF